MALLSLSLLVVTTCEAWSCKRLPDWCCLIIGVASPCGQVYHHSTAPQFSAQYPPQPPSNPYLGNYLIFSTLYNMLTKYVHIVCHQGIVLFQFRKHQLLRRTPHIHDDTFIFKCLPFQLVPKQTNSRTFNFLFPIILLGAKPCPVNVILFINC